MGFNPFRGRQAGNTGNKQAPMGLHGYNWEGAVVALRKTPDMSDRAFADAMGPHSWSKKICDDVRKVHRYRDAVRQELSGRAIAQQVEEEQRKGHEERIADGTASAQATPNKPGFFARLFGRDKSGRSEQVEQSLNPPAQPAQPSNAPSKVDASQINLVNYTPEQLMQQVHTDLAGVDLAAPWPVRFKESFGEIWSVIGPMLLFAGTAGEVFFFIWNNISDTSAWWVALSVLVTVAVLECTFMVVSYQSDTMRNRMKTKQGGATDEDKKDLINHKVFWFILAVGVGVGQIAFLVVGMSAKLNNLNFLILFSVGRSVFTLAGDFYTAFIHSEKPTSGDRLKTRNKQRADLTNDLLKQKSLEVSLINDGVLDLRKKHMEAVMRDEADKTELEMKRLENKSRIESRKILDDQARMFTNLGSGMMQALFDPKMDERERQKLLGVMQGFMSAAKYLPQTIVTEVKDDEEERGL